MSRDVGPFGFLEGNKKLSEVTRAHELMTVRRKLVSTFVDIGQQKDIWANGSPFHMTRTLFGYGFDDGMAEAIRRAMRAELRERIGRIDEDLGSLGVEVDGIEIAIAAEEALRSPQPAEEAA